MHLAILRPRTAHTTSTAFHAAFPVGLQPWLGIKDLALLVQLQVVHGAELAARCMAGSRPSITPIYRALVPERLPAFTGVSMSPPTAPMGTAPAPCYDLLAATLDGAGWATLLVIHHVTPHVGGRAAIGVSAPMRPVYFRPLHPSSVGAYTPTGQPSSSQPFGLQRHPEASMADL